MQQGLEQAGGGWLLFLDTDMRLSPQAISRAMNLARHENAGLLSVVPVIQCSSFWEKVLMPMFFSLVYLKFPPLWVNSPRKKEAAAAGGFLLFQRTTLDHVGGLACVRDRIVEDIALAGEVKSSGHRLMISVDPDHVTARMYAGLGAIWYGFLKNAFTGIGHSWPRAIGAVLTLVYVFIFPFAAALWGLSGFALPGNTPWMVAAPTLCCCAAVYLLRLHFDALHRQRSWHFLLQPVAGAFFAVQLICSGWKSTWGGGVQWKGRDYLGRKNQNRSAG
jgi:hypothetical protein